MKLKKIILIYLLIYLCIVIFFLFWMAFGFYSYHENYYLGKFLSLIDENKVSKVNQFTLYEYFKIIKETYSVFIQYFKYTLILFACHVLILLFLIRTLWVELKANNRLFLATLLFIIGINIFLGIQATYFLDIVFHESKSILEMIEVKKMSLIALKNYILNLDRALVISCKNLIHYSWFTIFSAFCNVILVGQSIYILKANKRGKSN